MRYAMMVLVGLLVGSTFTVDASAQSRGSWWAPLVEMLPVHGDEDRVPVYYRDRDDDDYRRNYDYERRGGKGKRGKGPAFCRSGAGHPVHGRRWCVDKGFSLGGYDYYDSRYEDRRRPRMERRRSLEDIILRRIPRRERILSPGALETILGHRAYQHLNAERRHLGSRAPVEGRWLITDRHTRVLQLRIGDIPLAELADFDGDGRVDKALVSSFR